MEAKFLLIWKSKYFLGDRAFPHMTYLDAQNMGAAEVAAFDHLKRSYGNEPNFLGDIGNNIGEADIVLIADRRQLDIEGYRGRVEEKRKAVEAIEEEAAGRRQYELLKEKYG